jgi:hypothetical protein
MEYNFPFPKGWKENIIERDLEMIHTSLHFISKKKEVLEGNSTYKKS